VPNLQFVINQCSLYFPKSSTQEILNEFLPRLQPLDTGKGCVIFELLSIFLNPREGYELWFADFMDLWDTYHNPPWSADMMNIMARLASQTIGEIDWEPYMATIFARILRCIDLPVSYKQMKSSKNQGMWSADVACWIVSMLGPKSSAQKYLSNFMVTIESYLHPANVGKWVAQLSELLMALNKHFFERLKCERYRVHPWKKPIPGELERV
jgi:proteasome activator subunit 4